MKKLFFLYAWLNLTRIAELRKEDLVKHIRKRTIQTGRLFFSSSLTFKQHLLSLTQGTNNREAEKRTSTGFVKEPNITQTFLSVLHVVQAQTGIPVLREFEPSKTNTQ